MGSVWGQRKGGTALDTAGGDAGRPGQRPEAQRLHTELREISGEPWSWTERAWDDRAVGGTMGEKTRVATASWAAGCLCEMG